MNREDLVDRLLNIFETGNDIVAEVQNADLAANIPTDVSSK